MRSRSFRNAFSVVVLAIMLMAFSGCDSYNPLKASQKSAAAAKKLEDVSKKLDVVTKAIGKAEAPVAALEDAVGAKLPDAAVSKVEALATKIEDISQTLALAATTLSAVPGPQQPIAGGVATILGALGALAGGIVAFAKNRRANQAESDLETASRINTALMNGIDPLPGAGKAIKVAAAVAGVSSEVESIYQDLPVSKKG